MPIGGRKTRLGDKWATHREKERENLESEMKKL